MKQVQIELMKLALNLNEQIDNYTEWLKECGTTQEILDKRNEAINKYANTIVELYKAIGSAGSARIVQAPIEMKSMVQQAEENNSGWFSGMGEKRA